MTEIDNFLDEVARNSFLEKPEEKPHLNQMPIPGSYYFAGSEPRPELLEKARQVREGKY